MKDRWQHRRHPRVSGSLSSVAEEDHDLFSLDDRGLPGPGPGLDGGVDDDRTDCPLPDLPEDLRDSFLDRRHTRGRVRVGGDWVSNSHPGS